MSRAARIRRSIIRYRRCGWGTSLAVHAALGAGLLVWSFEPWWPADWAARQQRAIQVNLAQAAPADDAADDGTPEVRIVSDPADVTAPMVRKRVEEVVEESAALSDADKFARLDTLSQRLNQVADEASINSLAGAMHSLLGTTPRATVPAKEAPRGAFDFDTAQFHDIQRFPKDGGGFCYVTVLLDAQGRTFEAEVTQQEGESIYAAMQRIKANPLLEQVYRQIVMPLLDQLLAGAKLSHAPAAEGQAPSEGEPQVPAPASGP